jgi:HSP20 family protein
MRYVSPWQQVRQLHDEMDRLIAGIWGPGLGNGSGGRALPALNVWETESDLWAEAELPGVAQDQLEISVVGGELTIKGERQAPKHGESMFHRRERSSGKFSRTVRLPMEVDADRVQARLKDGVLTVQLPKAEVAKPRKIKVAAV